ncbi:MAG: L,D-transpeptidase family protein [Candidatus Auribacterota bacterium]|nr:L,D-transpeptidase family protein [Candidatus Auribacterota bacterium]
MKIRIFMGLSVAALLMAGCVSQRPQMPPPPPPEEPLEVVGEEDVIIFDTGAETGEIVEISPEEETPAVELKDLTWEEIKGLGTDYKVAKGDTLSGIAGRHNVGTGLLERLNGLQDPNLIRIGQTLTVIEGPFRVKIDKSEKKLALYLGDTFIRSYPVTLGTKDSTPEGEFTVLRKLKNPPWTDPYNRTIVRADNPEYPLGTRWIEFIPPPGAYGIHGTMNEEEIGQEASFGCVRVLHPQEEEVYDFLILGSPVVITP